MHYINPFHWLQCGVYVHITTRPARWLYVYLTPCVYVFKTLKNVANI